MFIVEGFGGVWEISGRQNFGGFHDVLTPEHNQGKERWMLDQD